MKPNRDNSIASQTTGVITMERVTPADLKPVFITMKADAKQWDLIDTAAKILGVDRVRFILEAACQCAEEIIVDRKLFVLNEEAFDRFEKALDAHPIKSNECVKRLLARPKRWS